VPRKKPASQPALVGLLGIGLDQDDDQKRITRGEEFVLIGGSEDTHERMQEVAIRFEESLKERGIRLRDASPEEVIDLLHKARES
jgi:hypothetical protein